MDVIQADPTRKTISLAIEEMLSKFSSLKNHNSNAYYLFDKDVAVQVLFMFNHVLNDLSSSYRKNLYLSVSFFYEAKNVVAIQIQNKPFGCLKNTIEYLDKETELLLTEKVLSLSEIDKDIKINFF